MENKKQILSMQLNVDDFAPASDSEKESLSVMRESVSFWKDGLRRLRKNPIAMVSPVSYTHLRAGCRRRQGRRPARTE